jgi:hypothetical protein
MQQQAQSLRVQNLSWMATMDEVPTVENASDDEEYCHYTSKYPSSYPPLHKGMIMQGEPSVPLAVRGGVRWVTGSPCVEKALILHCSLYCSVATVLPDRFFVACGPPWDWCIAPPLLAVEGVLPELLQLPMTPLRSKRRELSLLTNTP